MESGSHALTLGRLYAWEKKLYEEVKVEILHFVNFLFYFIFIFVLLLLSNLIFHIIV